MNFLMGDNIVRKALQKMAALMYLNFLTVIFCLPIITAGASLTAMHNVLLKIVRNEEEFIRKSFVKSFKVNFKQATIIWLVMLIIVAVFVSDIFLVRGMSGSFPPSMVVMLIVAIFFAFMMAQYVFPLLSHFENTIGGTVKNAFILVFAEFPKTFLMTCASLSPLLFIYILGFRAIPTLVLFGLSVPGALRALCYNKAFKKLEPKEED